ncbi:MAG: hypothetical protein UX10_C0014G0008 [Candidatus Magasanikbacteria bacterium GW2011_GWA2_45_39]|uniref:Uncharacterized protein n=1 Tax=Candidatus Magasanikbacteria bacterium GW2011_GWA2_45_39 TaxID=1619041 RepID=A0A0G1PP64_9BACT|nr:MAG: hypothetical protein UX10_C0014G0008 [Candidatus Magasanikbacteria bacterium GW2011_GWA2_45_39]
MRYRFFRTIISLVAIGAFFFILAKNNSTKDKALQEGPNIPGSFRSPHYALCAVYDKNGDITWSGFAKPEMWNAPPETSVYVRCVKANSEGRHHTIYAGQYITGIETVGPLCAATQDTLTCTSKNTADPATENTISPTLVYSPTHSSKPRVFFKTKIPTPESRVK